MEYNSNSQKKPKRAFWGFLWLLSIIASILFIAPSVNEYLKPEQPTQTYENQTSRTFKDLLKEIELPHDLTLSSQTQQYQSTQTYQQVIPRTQTVYVTRTGSRYHRGDCHHLRQSKISISRNEAINRGYIQCKNCSP